MTRLYKKEIKFCNECPVCKSCIEWWGEKIYYYCIYKPKRKDGTGGRSIKETFACKEKIEIPKWCPLEETEKRPETSEVENVVKK